MGLRHTLPFVGALLAACSVASAPAGSDLSAATFAGLPCEDADCALETLYVSSQLGPTSTLYDTAPGDSIAEQLEAISELEGHAFDVVQTENNYLWLRDLVLPSSSAGYLRPRHSFPQTALAWFESSVLSAQTDSAWLFSPSGSLGTIAQYEPAAFAAEFRALKSALAPASETYTDLELEWGNLAFPRDRSGRRVVLVGGDSVILSAASLARRGKFREQDIEKEAKEISNDEALLRIPDLTRRVLSAQSGWVMTSKEQLAHEYFNRTHSKNPYYFQVESDPKKFISALDAYTDATKRLLPFTFATMNQAAQVRSVKRFLAKIRLTQREITKALGVPTRDILFLLQPFYHLDIFLRPGRIGEIFLQDWASTEMFDFAPLDAWPLERQRSVRAKLQSLAQQLSARFDVVTLEGLRVLGPNVYSKPYFGGIMTRRPVADTDAPCGAAPVGTNESPYFYITNHHRDDIDQQLRDTMATRGIRVHFIRNTKGEFFNNQSGVHCATLEKRTVPH